MNTQDVIAIVAKIQDIIIIVSIILIAIFIIINVNGIISGIKSGMYPPCVECRHYRPKKYLHVEYCNCNKNRDLITGEPKDCSVTRGTYKCKFERKSVFDSLISELTDKK